MTRLSFIILFFIFFNHHIFCQTLEQGDGKMTWEDFVEWIQEEDEDGNMDEETIDQLYELHANPIDINNATKADLLVLPFLDEEQVDDILLYRDKYGPVKSMGEMMYVKKLSRKDREMMGLFVMAGEENLQKEKQPSLAEMLKGGKHETVWSSDIPFYKKEGYLSKEDASSGKSYLGDPYHHAFRYAFASNNQLLAGVQAEKDAGERGVDYYSAYVMVKDLGMLKRAVIGNYKASFGQGLAMNSGMKWSKGMMMSSLDKMDAGFSKHSSNSEAGYFSGAAATIKIKDWEVSAFGSYRKEDGTWNKEMTGITSVKKDGLHRTVLEDSKKDVLPTTNWGGNVHWEHGGLKLSSTLVLTHFTKPLMPQATTPSTYYRAYNATGKDFMVGSVAYSYRYKKWMLSGETAYSDNTRQNGTATLNAIRWKMDSNNTFMLVGRYYGAKFVSINGKAFGENSLVQNEAGVMMGWTTRSLSNLELNSYVDMMHFPWMKQGVSGSSNGFEGVVQAVYTPNSKCDIQVKYRIKAKEKDYKENDDSPIMLLYKTEQNLRIQMTNVLSKFITLRSSVVGTTSHFVRKPDNMGFSISENVRWQHPKTKCRLDLSVIYFNTDGYNSRVYQSEPSLLYAFGSSSFYDKGIRTALVAAIPVRKQSLFLYTKLGMTKYFNRDTIGTGLERIDSHHREDLQVQLRWHF